MVEVGLEFCIVTKRTLFQFVIDFLKQRKILAQFLDGKTMHVRQSDFYGLDFIGWKIKIMIVQFGTFETNGIFAKCRLGILGNGVIDARRDQVVVIRQQFSANDVSSLNETRQAWRDVADSLEIPFIEIEVVCSDEREHRHRIDTRIADIPGIVL